MNRLISITEQIVLFKDCKWSPECTRIVIRTEKGEIVMGRQKFEVAFGGYTFMLDDNNERVTRSAWAAFKALGVVQLRGGWGW